jgi:hypothetical protein
VHNPVAGGQRVRSRSVPTWLVVSNCRSSIASFAQGVRTSRFIRGSTPVRDLLGTLHLVIDTLEKFLRVSGIKLARERK